MRIFFITIISALLLATANTSARAQEATLLSPPLDMLGGRCLAIVAPPRWSISDHEPSRSWSGSSYDFALAPQADNDLTTDKLQAEVLQHGIERARLHGDLDGRPFRTASGLRGILHHAEFKPGTRDWYLTIPVHSTGNAVIIRVIFLKGSLTKQRAFVGQFYRNVRFLAPSQNSPPKA